MADDLDRVVSGARRRLFRMRVERRLARALRLALAGSVVLLGADRIWRLRFEPWWVIGTALGLALLGGLALAYRRRISRLDAALLLDEQLGLEERLSSALSLREAGGDHPLRQTLLEDAHRHAAEIDLRTALPRRWPAETNLCLGLFALLVITAFLPQFGFWRSETERATEMVSGQVGEELREVARRVEERAEDEDATVARKQARELMREALKLRRARMDKEQALRRLETVNRKLQAEREKLAGRPLRRTGKEARRDLRRMGGLQEQIADNLENESLDAARALLEETARQLREGTLSQQDAKRLAEQLRRAAEALKDSPQHDLAEKLRKAAEALERAAKERTPGACEKAGQALEEAAEALGDAAGTLGDQDLLEELQDYVQGAKGALGDCEGLYNEGQRENGGECPNGLCERYGAGRAGRSRGPGSTNEGAEPSPSEGAPQYPYQEGDSPDDGSGADYERLYAPRRTETLQHDERAEGVLNRSGNVRTTVGPRESPQLSDAYVPFYEVLEAYESEADDALSRGDIPLVERQRVKTYFEELHEPAGER